MIYNDFKRPKLTLFKTHSLPFRECRSLISAIEASAVRRDELLEHEIDVQPPGNITFASDGEGSDRR